MNEFHPELFDLAMSAKAQPLLDAVKKHIAENVDPISEEFHALQKEKDDPWTWHPRQRLVCGSPSPSAERIRMRGPRTATARVRRRAER